MLSFQGPSFTNKAGHISAFVHPSMIEDPWKDLMERREAIKRSEINLSTPAKQNEEKSCMDNISVESAGQNESEGTEEEAEEEKETDSP